MLVGIRLNLNPSFSAVKRNSHYPFFSYRYTALSVGKGY
jgi:hypothetical protein